MKRKQRTEILIGSPSGFMKALAEEIVNNYETSVIEEPNPGLVMVKVRETAKQSLFYLGEVLVTECKVQVQGATGIGLIKGDDSEKAYFLAVIDAAYAAGLKETVRWEELLGMEQEKQAVERTHRQRKLQLTKVNFETMDSD
ncbi:phosphonate C-P lyase system protein PhnG [Paenibacillus jiagnxiensis]|uniref:phosphonate C-P lyase system protein PhnG n=1 Tax=Paenibacillus jiagnxiensis TaxID=3228926 RepID=UPI0033AFAF79